MGDKLTQADVAVWDALDAVTDWIEGADLKDYPRLEKFHEKISQRPGIETYLRQRK